MLWAPKNVLNIAHKSQLTSSKKGEEKQKEKKEKSSEKSKSKATKFYMKLFGMTQAVATVWPFCILGEWHSGGGLMHDGFLNQLSRHIRPSVCRV